MKGLKTQIGTLLLKQIADLTNVRGRVPADAGLGPQSSAPGQGVTPVPMWLHSDNDIDEYSLVSQRRHRLRFTIDSLL